MAGITAMRDEPSHPETLTSQEAPAVMQSPFRNVSPLIDTNFIHDAETLSSRGTEERPANLLLAETSAFGPRPSTIEKQPTEVGPRTPAQATPSATQVTPSMERRNREKQASLEKKKTRLVKQIDQVKMATAEGGKAQQILTRQITQRI